MKSKTALITFAAWASLPFRPTLAAQTPEARTVTSASEEFEELDLESLLSLEVSVASLRATTIRESPGIVSVITRDEMLAWGARDLIDVLRMVPGFYLGVDVFGVVGLGTRGHWAQEGKVLLIIDDHEINDLDFQTLSLGHHFPVEILERIEIIRGPGSAIYGGNAELGVIRVQTRSPETLQGVNLALRYAPPAGFYGGDGDRTGFLDVTAEAGATNGDLAWSLGASIGRSVRSDEIYSPIDPAPGSGEAQYSPYDMGTASTIRPLLVRGSARYNKVQLRLMYDGYRLESRDSLDAITADTYTHRHGGIYGELKGTIEMTEQMTLTPYLSYRRQEAWFTEVDEDNVAALRELKEAGLYAQRALHRIRGGVRFSWDAFSDANLLLGIEGFYDRGEIADDGLSARDPTLFELNSYADNNGRRTDTIDFFTTAFYGQLLWPNPIVNITVGARTEIHTAFGLSAAPRLALTKVFDFGLHTKLLAAQAFRTPSFRNKTLNKDVRIERTTVFEAELGYTLPSGFSVTANGFVTMVRDPIIYFVEETTVNGQMIEQEGYRNQNETATAGYELQAQLEVNRFRGFLSYSYYQRILNPVRDYEVPDTRSLLAGPRHKITARLTIELLNWLRATPSLSWMIDRHAFTPRDPNRPLRLPNEALLGLALNAEDIGVRGFDVGVVGHDLLNQTEAFPQPYAGGHAVLPGRGRQVMLRLSYQHDL